MALKYYMPLNIFNKEVFKTGALKTIKHVKRNQRPS